MKQTVAESKNPDEAREKFKTWMANNPEIAKNLELNDIEMQAVRVEGGTLFRIQVNLPSN